MTGCWAPLHYCIDNAIHTFAGIQLRLECARLMRKQGHLEPTGRAKVTPAYNLPSRHVIHTVGPISNGVVDDRRMRALLAPSYRTLKTWTRAAEADDGSIALCCISTGSSASPPRRRRPSPWRPSALGLAERDAAGLPRPPSCSTYKESDEILHRDLLRIADTTPKKPRSASSRVRDRNAE